MIEFVKKEPLNIAILGHRFMGRAHSNAWSQAGKFFDPARQPVLKVACGRDEAELKAFAARWGWEETETDWRRVIDRPDIDVVDIALPTWLHAETAIAAARAGKHLFCEKPLSLTSAEGEAMLAAAESAGVVHYLNHNYRRCPAVALARRLIDEGSLGALYHYRGAYQQSQLLDPRAPVSWKHRAATAGGGPQWDLNSHSVDTARYLAGDIRSVTGLTRTFIPERLIDGDPDRTSAVEVDDAALMMVEFVNGALGSFEASRYAAGRRNHHTFELYGSRGALAWDLEDMNRLQYFSMDDPAHARGFRGILATERIHPYAGHWWPPGHIIGYEHSFVHAVADFIDAVANGTPIAPDFADGVRIMKILEAGAESARTGKRIEVAVAR